MAGAEGWQFLLFVAIFDGFIIFLIALPSTVALSDTISINQVNSSALSFYSNFTSSCLNTTCFNSTVCFGRYNIYAPCTDAFCKCDSYYEYQRINLTLNATSTAGINPFLQSEILGWLFLALNGVASFILITSVIP